MAQPSRGRRVLVVSLALGLAGACHAPGVSRQGEGLPKGVGGQGGAAKVEPGRLLLADAKRLESARARAERGVRTGDPLLETVRLRADTKREVLDYGFQSITSLDGSDPLPRLRQVHDHVPVGRNR